MLKRLALTTSVFAAAAAPAFAHLDPLEHGSFAAGISHPLFGADHVLVMISVGLWASQVASQPGHRNAIWTVPAAFVGTMAVGFLLALLGIHLPFVEPAILASVIGLGLLVATAARLPSSACAAIVAIFALFHGHAHGSELGGAGAFEFGAGFIISTALLHGVGIVLGQTIGRFAPSFARAIGALTALAGVSLLFG